MWTLIVLQVALLSSPQALGYSLIAESTIDDPESAPIGIAILGRGGDVAEFSAYIESHPGLKSYVKNYLEQKPNSEVLARLNQQFEAAQFEFLSNNFEVAKDSFKKIFASAFDQDWPEPFRIMMFESALRVAVCQVPSQTRAEWLTKAHNFAPDLKPSQATYSEFIQREFTKIASKTPLVNVKLVGTSDRYAILVRNGKPLSLRGKTSLRLPPGPAREVWLSHNAQPILRQVQRPLSPPSQEESDSLVQGTCEEPALGSEVWEEDVERHIFFRPTCVAIYSKGTWRIRNPLARPTKLSPKYLPNTSSAADTEIFERPYQQKESLFKRPWFWAGIAALAIGFVYWQRQQPSPAGPRPGGPPGPQEPTIIPVP